MCGKHSLNSLLTAAVDYAADATTIHTHTWVIPGKNYTEKRAVKIKLIWNIWFN